jgi:hypothetical protein
MADRVQPPEGLRKIAAEALAKFWNESIANIGEPVETLYHSDDAQESADAVLAALFDACEVRELLRRCDLQTPPESVGPYPENVQGGG